MRGDPHVRFRGRGYPDPTIIMPLQYYLVQLYLRPFLKIAGRIEIRSFVRNKVAIGRTSAWIESYALKFFKSGFMDKSSAKGRRNAISQSKLRLPLRSFRTAPWASLKAKMWNSASLQVNENRRLFAYLLVMLKPEKKPIRRSYSGKEFKLRNQAYGIRIALIVDHPNAYGAEQTD
ncbi:hypothetical protein LXL04_004323 [Taraxacum kok-saghyz]